MPKINFKKFVRFDAKLAADGVAHPIVDNLGQYRGTFTTRFMDADNKALQMLNDKYRREHGQEKEARGRLAGVFSFVHVVLSDWDGVEDADGKEVPFSKEAAFDLLGDEEGDSWLFRTLIARSQDEANYAPSLETKKADVAKN